MKNFDSGICEDLCSVGYTCNRHILNPTRADISSRPTHIQPVIGRGGRATFDTLRGCHSESGDSVG